MIYYACFKKNKFQEIEIESLYFRQKFPLSFLIFCVNNEENRDYLFIKEMNELF